MEENESSSVNTDPEAKVAPDDDLRKDCFMLNPQVFVSRFYVNSSVFTQLHVTEIISPFDEL